MGAMGNPLRTLSLFLFLLVHANVCLLTNAQEGRQRVSTVDRQRIIQLEKEASMMSHDPAAEFKIWQEIYRINPRNLMSNIRIGLLGVGSPDFHVREKSMKHLQRAFSNIYVDHPIPMPSVEGESIAAFVARYQWERRDFESARSMFKMSQSARVTPSTHLCVSVSLATMLDPFPRSIANADESMESYLEESEMLIQQIERKKLRIDGKELGQRVAGAAPDPYVHCVLSIFHLSFYYRADIALAANRHYRMAKALWPELSYIPPQNAVKISSDSPKPCRDRKIRLGIISGAMYMKTSVVADFSGVLKRLDRKKFDITYIYLNESNSMIDGFVRMHKQDKVLILRKEEFDVEDGAWIIRHHKTILDLDLDILYYLDLTMSTHAQRMAMTKLAKVQANSHGHPVTSGIPREIVDYYISWGAAELEYDKAKDHYTEELKLIPKESMHQYYEERSDGTHSLINGLNYIDMVHAGRNESFGLHHDNGIPPDGHWYLCMQKPHKFHPEIDPLITNVIKKDPQARVILHDTETIPNMNIFRRRLSDLGCDLSRVHFLPSQDHHRLLALYALSDVILDSYPAGGCTTTREVLELGKPVVTLPARLLGGRWTYAYYQQMGDEKLNSMVIASSVEEYVDMAVRLANEPDRMAEVKQRIEKSLHKLYRRKDSVESWENILMEIAPISIPEKGRTCSDMREEL